MSLLKPSKPVSLTDFCSNRILLLTNVNESTKGGQLIYLYGLPMLPFQRSPGNSRKVRAIAGFFIMYDRLTKESSERLNQCLKSTQNGLGLEMNQAFAFNIHLYLKELGYKGERRFYSDSLSSIPKLDNFLDSMKGKTLQFIEMIEDEKVENAKYKDKKSFLTYPAFRVSERSHEKLNRLLIMGKGDKDSNSIEDVMYEIQEKLEDLNNLFSLFRKEIGKKKLIANFEGAKYQVRRIDEEHWEFIYLDDRIVVDDLEAMELAAYLLHNPNIEIKISDAITTNVIKIKTEMKKNIKNMISSQEDDVELSDSMSLLFPEISGINKKDYDEDVVLMKKLESDRDKADAMGDEQELDKCRSKIQSHLKYMHSHYKFKKKDGKMLSGSVKSEIASKRVKDAIQKNRRKLLNIIGKKENSGNLQSHLSQHLIFSYKSQYKIDPPIQWE